MSMPCFANMRIMAGIRFSMVPAPCLSSIIGVSSQTASPSGVLTPLPCAEHSRMMEAAATSRVSNGFMNASPSALMSIAPTERTFSVTSAPKICAGKAAPVGWY